MAMPAPSEAWLCGDEPVSHRTTQLIEAITYLLTRSRLYGPGSGERVYQLGLDCRRPIVNRVNRSHDYAPLSAVTIDVNRVPIAVETAFMLVTAPSAIKAAMRAYSIRS